MPAVFRLATRLSAGAVFGGEWLQANAGSANLWGILPSER
jgi:hypothetical protein